MSNQKEEMGPGLFSVIFLGVLTLGLGKMLGLASLISQPVLVVTKTPEADSLTPGTVYYQKGDRSGRTVWRAKEEAWKAGTVSVLSLSEVELNQWSSDRLKIDNPSQGAEDSGMLDRLQIQVSPVNFKIIDDQVQLATEVQSGFFEGRTFLYQVRGRFVSTPQGVVFVQEAGNLGSAPVGSFPVYKDLVLAVVRKQFERSPESAWLKESFASLESVEVTDGQLILRRRAEG